MIERLPTPWGLVRLGVAPDHPNIKAVSRAFEKIASQPGFRFFGNVDVGSDVTHEELAERYDAVLYAVGAQTDRQLGIPGEDLPGSWPATAFVAWYNGHPDFQQLEFDLSHERAVVIGNGNVALDVARMLALTPEELAPTDTTDAAIDAINAAGVREILVIGRRGPVQAAWTPVEVGELGELAGADILVDPADMRARRGERGRARGRAADGEAERRPPPGLRGARARGEAARDPPPLPRVSRRDPRRREGRGDRARPQRARRRQGGRDRRDGDRAVRDRLPERRLPGRRASGRPVRRGQRDDPERGRPRAAGPLRRRAGSSAARAASSARTRRTRPRRSSCCSRTPAPASCLLRAGTISRSSSRSAAVDHVLYSGWEAIDSAERTAGEPRGRPRVKLCTWDELLEAARTPGA